MSARIRPLPILIGMVSGAACGAALMVLLQQFSVLALTRGTLVTGVVIGAVIGVLAPLGAALAAGRRTATAGGEQPAAPRF